MEIWNACTQEPNSWLRWIECHPGTAGWLQAIFSILAIIATAAVSYGVMEADRRYRAKERFARSENLLVSVAGDVFPLYGLIQRRKQHIEVLIGRRPADAMVKSTLEQLDIPINDRLNSTLPLLMDLDTAVVEPLRQILSAAAAYNSFLDGLIKASPFDPAQWDGAIGRLQRNRERLESHTQELIDRYMANAK